MSPLGMRWVTEAPHSEQKFMLDLPRLHGQRALCQGGPILARIGDLQSRETGGGQGAGLWRAGLPQASRWLKFPGQKP